MVWTDRPPASSSFPDLFWPSHVDADMKRETNGKEIAAPSGGAAPDEVERSRAVQASRGT
jgi:hypothetical protein